MNYWLVKSEPFKYPWDKFVADGSTFWDGVRNYQARNNLKEMQLGDLVLFYHSNEGKEIVGYAEVIKEHYQDPTTDDTNWVVVDLKPVRKFQNTITLDYIKKDEQLSKMELVRLSRISVVPVRREEFDRIIALGES